MKLKSIIAAILILTLSQYETTAQKKDMYVAPNGSLMTFANSQMGVFGDIINDAVGGINNQDGGKVILYRRPSTSSTPSRVYDGPLAPSYSDNYNSGGAYIRVYDLVTDNATGTAVPSATEINQSTGSGDIQIEQELRVSHEHLFSNGVVWTPRDKWQHAYVHYESNAYYTNAAQNNTSGPHIDGYAAYSGDSDFTFPVGDGIVSRTAGVVSPQQGIYKAAYFRKNPQLGTQGLSGNSTASSPINSPITKVSTQEFWDIDGTAATRVSLSAYNTGLNYSGWDADFMTAYNVSNKEIGITAWDEWEYLGNSNATNNVYAQGNFTTTQLIVPDSNENTGNAYAVFTWAEAIVTHLAVDQFKPELSLSGCNTEISYTKTKNPDAVSAHIMRTDKNGMTIEVAEVKLDPNREDEYTIKVTDSTVSPNNLYLYMVRLQYNDGSFESSIPESIYTNCDQGIEWNLFPNPTQGKITLSANQEIEAEVIQAIDMRGRIVEKVNIKGQNKRSFDMDLSGKSNGIYIISIQDDQDNALYQHVVNLNAY